MPQERSYQTDHIEEIITEVSSERKVLGQLPTGGGKTVEFCLIAKRYIERTGKSVLILVHREELLAQAAETVKDVLDINPYLITSSTNRYFISRVYIGMVESTVKRTHMFDNVGLVIIDECHIANFNKVHSIFLEELIIGFSATPISSSKKDPLINYYRKIIVGPQINELIKMGFLSQNTTRAPKDVVDSSNFEVDKLKGDFNENKMALEYKKPNYIIAVVKAYHKYKALGKKCVIYNVNIAHSKEVNECFVSCGYNSRHLDSMSGNRPSEVIDPRKGTFFKNEREEILYWLKVTPDAVLQNVGIATTGFDEPTIEFIFLNFSTLSLPKFLQCSGRGGRIIDQHFIDKYQVDYPYPVGLKNKFDIIDMGGNVGRFGDWNWDRDWAYLFRNPTIPGDGVAPVKTCPNCDGIVHAAVTECPLTTADGEPCLYEFIRRKSTQPDDLGEMVIITKEVPVNILIEKNKKKYDYFTMFEIGEKVVDKMFERIPKPSQTVVNTFFRMYYELCKDWYKKTLANKDGNIPDISESAWHIRRAKNNFEKLLKEYEPNSKLQVIIDEEYKINGYGGNCVSCAKQTFNTCYGCKEPYCMNCEQEDEFCPECTAVNKKRYHSLKTY